jgi:hypothetical protein
VAAEADNEVLRQYAETLAREELGHAALLRAERRLAFHAERDINPAEVAPDPRPIQNEIELLATAIQIDRYLAEAIGKVETHSPQLAALARQTRQKILNNENVLNELAPNYSELPGAEIPRTLTQVGSNEVLTEDESGSLDSELQRLSIFCDLSFAFYDAIVETTTDESTMRTAQSLTSSALDRICVLKQVAGNE